MARLTAAQICLVKTACCGSVVTVAVQCSRFVCRPVWTTSLIERNGDLIDNRRCADRDIGSMVAIPSYIAPRIRAAAKLRNGLSPITIVPLGCLNKSLESIGN